MKKETIVLYYDDRLPVAQLADGDICLNCQNVSSRQIGSQQPDEAVLRYCEETQCYLAAGTGRAVLSTDDKTYIVDVLPAPISLFLIIGHSLGQGALGDPSQSVLCPLGQSYSSYQLSSLDAPGPLSGIGAACLERPAEVDAFELSGAGTPGEGSALAYEWNRLTGEKIWVLNAAVGGSCLNEWVKGSEFYEHAVLLYRRAAFILQQEVAAGHYALQNVVVLYHSGTNYNYKKVFSTPQLIADWYDSFLNGLRADLTRDLGEGFRPVFGIIPAPVTKPADGEGRDIPANCCMAVSSRFPDVFLASWIGFTWQNAEGLRRHFPEPDYPTHGMSLRKPQTFADFHAPDGVHYSQVGYNAVGLDAAHNIFTYLRKKPIANTLSLYDIDRVPLDATVSLEPGTSLWIVPNPEPGFHYDLDITTNGDLVLLDPLSLQITGTGTISFSRGDCLLAELTVQNKNMKKIKVAQIGTSENSHGTVIWNLLLKQTDFFDVVGYAFPENEREKFPDQATVFDGHKEMTVEEILSDPEIEAVVVETEEIYLTKYAIMVAQAGKHLHMEKPGGVVLADFEKLIGILKSKKSIFSTGYMYRFNPKIKEAIAKVRNGELGEIYSVEAHMDCKHSNEVRSWLKGFPGGMLFFLGCHLIDLIYQIMGEPEEVLSLSCSTHIGGIDTKDYGMAVFRYKNGISFAKTCDVEYGGFLRRQLVICGEKGTIEIKPLEVIAPGGQYTVMNEALNASWNEPWDTTKTEIYGRFDDMMKNFAEMIRGKKNPYSYDYELNLYKLLLKSCGGEI